MTGPAPIGRRDHLVGLLLAVGWIAVLMATSVDLAMSRDESFYVVAAERYGAWIVQAFEDFDAASQQRVIDATWSYNHEHPSLAKSAFALSHLAHERWDLFPTPGMSIRFPGMLTAGLLLWLIWIFGARAYGRQAGAFAALAFALLPRPFYHSHLDAFDIPIVLMLTWTTYCYWRSLERPRWAVWAGIAYGCALATKHNAWILPGVLLIHWTWTVSTEVRARRRGAEPRLGLVPWWLVSMAALGPALFVGSWPWLWHETVPRFEEYAAFHMSHAYYNMAYFGENYFWPPFPVSFPWVMTLYTVPLTTLLLGVAGLGMRSRAVVPPTLVERVWPGGSVRPDRRFTEVLFVGSFLAPLVVISLPSTPIFGGTKHWFPSYPFLALFAGVAFWRTATVARERFGPRWPRLRPVLPALVGAILLLPALAETAHGHPFGLSHYTWVAGGVPGAADDGMNRQFWGFTHGSLAGFLEERMPEGGSVWICDATAQSWRMMQRDGMIPPNIRATGHMAAADFVLVHHEHHFDEVDFQAWVAFDTVRPARVLTYDGVPLVTVYENPRRR